MAHATDFERPPDRFTPLVNDSIPLGSTSDSCLRAIRGAGSAVPPATGFSVFVISQLRPTISCGPDCVGEFPRTSKQSSIHWFFSKLSACEDDLCGCW